MERDADDSRGGTSGAIALFRELARHPEVGALRARLQRIAPYLVGAVMFGVAVWVLHSALRRYDLADLHSELATLTANQIWLAILFTFASFLALIGYEWSALGLVGKRMPLGHLSVASFATQSIAHSTGFAFVIGASLRYHFYSDRGLGIADVALVQMYFTATFTLGVATLAGGVVMLEPWRLAAATGLPPMLWRAAASWCFPAPVPRSRRSSSASPTSWPWPPHSTCCCPMSWGWAIWRCSRSSWPRSWSA